MFVQYSRCFATAFDMKTIGLCVIAFCAFNALAADVRITTNSCYTASANGLTWKYDYDYGDDYRCKGYKVVGKYQERYTYQSVGMSPWKLDSISPVDAAIDTQISGTITVPSQLANMTITGLGDYAFYNCSNLTVITIPSTITNIQSTVFCGCNKNLKVVFLGNAPACKDDWHSVGRGLLGTAYVMPTSTGWNVDIPGKWMGMSIDYLKCVQFNANGGSISAANRYIANGEAVGTLPTPSKTGYTFTGWYTAASGGTKISAETTVSANTTYYAHWSANNYTISYNENGGSGTTTSTTATYNEDTTLAACGFTCYAKQFAGWATEANGEVVYSAGQKVSNLTAEPNGTIILYAVWETLVVPSTQVSTIGGTTFCGDSYTVTLSCPLDGTTIYFTTNGVTPRTSAAFAYTEPIVIYGNADIVALAVKDGVKSEYARVTITQIAPDPPVVTPANGTEFRSETCEVAITCATEGAEIYYTLDGSTPQKETGIKYTVPFTIADTTTVKAIAVGGPLMSEVVTATISKRALSLAEAAGMIELTFNTDENVPWCPIVDTSAASGFAAQSGTIGMNASTWMETSVRGAGTFSFKWRVECEKDDSGGATWDRLVVFTNAVEAARIDGVTEWRNVSFVFGDEGKHTIRWEFVKDDYDEEGATFADNAWVSGVSWVSNDPIPAIEESSELGWALSLAQDKEKLSDKLTSVAAYQSFRNWVDGNGLSHMVVRDAPNAWLSYALDAPGLMAKTTPLASEDVAIEAIEPSSITSGAFDLVVDIAGAEIGTAANLTEVFGVEGAAELDESAFSSEGLTVTLQRTADGKAKATVTPDGTPPSFFLRVKVK